MITKKGWKNPFYVQQMKKRDKEIIPFFERRENWEINRKGPTELDGIKSV